MSAITYRHYDRLADSPVLTRALEVHAALRRSGETNVLVPALDGQVLAAFHGRECIGLLVWSECEDESVWWTELGWVAEAHRHAGIYRALWQRCVARAKRAGIRAIDGGHAVINEKMPAVMRSLGREPVAVVYRYWVGGREIEG